LVGVSTHISTSVNVIFVRLTDNRPYLRAALFSVRYAALQLRARPVRYEVEHIDFGGKVHICARQHPYLWDPAKSKRAQLQRFINPSRAAANHRRATSSFVFP